MKQKICYVIGAGENYGLDFCPKPDDYVIAADGGLKYLEQCSIKPDLVIGDCLAFQHILLKMDTTKSTIVSWTSTELLLIIHCYFQMKKWN